MKKSIMMMTIRMVKKMRIMIFKLKMIFLYRVCPIYLQIDSKLCVDLPLLVVIFNYVQLKIIQRNLQDVVVVEAKAVPILQIIIKMN